MIPTQLDDILFEVTALDSDTARITEKYVTGKIRDILENEGLSRRGL